MTPYLLLLVLLVLVNYATPFNILAIISIPIPSHYMAIHPLFRELATRGHSVTVINSFPDKQHHPNLTFVNLKRYYNRGHKLPLEFYESKDSTYLHLFNFCQHLLFMPTNVAEDCEQLFVNEQAVAHLASGKKYDVIFVEQFVSDCALAYAAALYDAPIIGITSHVLMPQSYSRLGIPFGLASDGYYFSDAGPNPSLYHKVETVILKTYWNTIARWLNHRQANAVFSRHLPNYTLDIERIAKERMRMMFVYQQFSLTGARLLAPQLLEIGGIHIGKPKPVPEQIERFLSSAKHGAIYMSFGSNLKSSTMSRKKLQQFLDAFAKVPHKVIWKWENDSFPEGYDNVFVSSWLPQFDILCHPKVVGYILQGGMLSLSEATYCGKPVITIPFFGDQFSNAASVRAVGLGKTLRFDTLNADTLAEAIKDITSEEIQENAKRISKQWHDRPLSVMDSAIFWTEHVARHKLSPPSLPSKHVTWFESTLIDVYITLTFIVITGLWLLYITFKVVRILLSLCCTIFRGKVKKE